MKKRRNYYEGLAADYSRPEPVPEALAKQLMAAAELLKNKPKPTDADINEYMTNICRCGTFQQIRAAIHAALHPQPGDTLFFVARGDGGHHFSVTLAEHEQAVRKYQLSRREGYRSSPEQR